MQRTRSVFAAAVVLGSLMAGADDITDTWGPAVGTTLPAFAAADQNGEVRDLESLSGDKGLLLFMVRSADW